MYSGLTLADRAHGAAFGVSLEGTLLARHRQIDEWLTEAIESGQIGQVVEVAAGMSPRGLRFKERYPHLIYIEADLEGMASRKRAALQAYSLLTEGHRVVVIDAMTDDGPHALSAICAENLDPKRGTAIVTEGLVNYFPRALVVDMWQRFAQVLDNYPAGLYLSDIHTSQDTLKYRAARYFRRMIEAFARGGLHFHFESADECEGALKAAGFKTARVAHPSGLPAVDIVHVLRAT